MKKLKPKPHQFWAWCSTLTILMGAITAALGYYPLYCYIFLIGNSGLAVVSWLWNEKSLPGFRAKTSNYIRVIRAIDILTRRFLVL